MLLFTLIGLITALMPSTRRKFAAHDPSMFPSAILLCASSEAITDETNSGADVPYATIVREITRDETPIFAAVFDAPSTSRSALLYKKMIPTARKSRLSNGLSGQ